MMSLRLCGMTAARAAIAKPASASTRLGINSSIVRSFAQDVKTGFSRQTTRRRTLKETLTAPTKGMPFSIGQGAVAGGAVVGLGALAFYGLGLSNEAGAIDRSVMWPQYVKDRIRDTYGYFAASIGLTAGTAVGIFRTPALMNIVARGGMVSMVVAIAAMIGSGMVVRSLPYEPGTFGAKQLAWMGHCAVVAAVVAPICMLGGPILTRAAWYTAGMVGGLSTVAVCAPSEKFLTMGGPLAMGFGVVLASSLGSAFLPPTTALGAGLYSIALYGGLILFGGFMLYDTQKILHRAEMHPQYGVTKYDPINNSISIYADTVNIFIRIAQMLAMGGGRK